MRRVNLIVMAWAVFAGLFLGACANDAAVVGIDQSGGAVGPQEIEGATEVIRFDPASIPLSSSDPVPGECEASTAVLGAYRCALEAGDPAEPCFPVDGGQLLCGPNPVAGTYRFLVELANTLPAVPPPPPDRVMAFVVELDGGMTCALRTAPEPVIIGGVPAVYDCDEPYTYIPDGGELTLDRSAPTWTAAVYTLDPATGESSGGTPAGIRRVWVP